MSACVFEVFAVGNLNSTFAVCVCVCGLFKSSIPILHRMPHIRAVPKAFVLLLVYTRAARQKKNPMIVRTNVDKRNKKWEENKINKIVNSAFM